LYRYQWMGLSLLALLPLLALAGAFGERWSALRAANTALEVTVTFPTVFRYKQVNQIQVRVRNRRPAALDTVRIAVDTTYLAGFSTINAMPSFSQPFELTLADIPPGGERLAVIEMQAERYGRFSGSLRVSSGSDAPLPLSLNTFIYP
jgi:hypothetical protein